MWEPVFFLDRRGNASRRRTRRIVNAAPLIQSAVRAWIIRRKPDAVSITGAYFVKAVRFARRARMHIRTNCMAVGVRVTTGKLSAAMREALKRVRAAKAAATEEMKLGNRTTAALDWLLSSRDLSLVMKASPSIH